MNKIKSIIKTLGLIIIGIFPMAASAHENYVLPSEEINAGMHDYSLHVLNALKTASNLRVATAVSVGSFIGIALYFWFQHSAAGIWLDEQLIKLQGLGELALRLALAASFLFSAKTFAYLGPEIGVSALPAGNLIHTLLYLTGALLVLGLFGQAVGLISLGIICVATYVYKSYILTYFNYFGEFIALIIFGSGWLSLDNLIFPHLRELREKYRDWEMFIIRVTYGISILYPAISIKLLHPIIIVEIVEKYNLTQFHWLLPHDPLLISLGTGLAQVAVGLALIIGFQTRLNTLVTFTLMVMSVLFFKEAVWPHYILLALAFYLMINNGGKISLDEYIRGKLRKKIPATSV